jgi:cell division protein FtsW
MMAERRGKIVTRLETSRPDYGVLVAVALLLLVGLQAVYSASFVLAISQYDNSTYFVLRQGLWAALGVALMIILMRLDYHRWRLWSKWMLLAGVVLLLLTFFSGFGVEENGATRWVKVGALPPVQPSEFLKLALIIYLAAWLASKGERVRQVGYGFLPFALLTGVIGGLVLKQPDFGTAVILVSVATVLYFVAGADVKHVLLFLLIVAAAALVAVNTASYRSDRWQAFVDPWQDPKGIGFHVIQSLIALGSGGLTGLGAGASRQKFFYIPGSHTDGVFAIIGEELGFIGCVVVILLLAALVYRGFVIAGRAPDRFGALLATGIVCWIALQALVNIGGVTRSIPMTGIPLPFISFGGSNLATVMAAVGILLSVSRYRLSPEPNRKRFVAAEAKA